MTLLSTFLYYTCFASTILFYGIGVNQIIDLNLFQTKTITYMIKVVISILLSTVFSWLLTSMILIPLHIVELFPVVCFFIYICVTTFMEALTRITTNKSTAEFIFSYLIVLLSVMESTSLLNTLVIAGSCLAALVLLCPFIYSFKARANDDNISKEKFYSRYLLFIAILIFIISVWDVIWLNPGVIK